MTATVWVLVLICVNSFWCSAGDIWQTDQYYQTKIECKEAGALRAKRRNMLIMCLEGERLE